MTDLDQLLRSDAERWNRDRPAIDLNQAAAAATASGDEAPADVSAQDGGEQRLSAGAERRRLRALAPLLSAAAVVIIAASLALTGVFDKQDSAAELSHSSASGAPSSPTRGATTGSPSPSPVTYLLAGGAGEFVSANPKQLARLMANGGLTAKQAMRKFKAHDPAWRPPAEPIYRYGFFTLEHGATGDHYLRTPTWAIVQPGCASPHAIPNGPRPKPPPAGCQSWVLLDAYTGSLLLIANGP
jgi:hypothetical protein